MRCRVCDSDVTGLIRCSVCNCEVEEVKRCPVCEAKVEGLSKIKKYCSIKCRDKKHYSVMKVCNRCQKLFRGESRRKYCSHACAIRDNVDRRKMIYDQYREMEEDAPH